MNPEPSNELTRLRELPKAALALGVLVATTAIAVGDVPTWEEEVFERLNQLPQVLEPVLWAPMQLGSLFGPVVVAVGSWWAWRRWRPSIGSVAVGILAWQAAKAVKGVIERGRPSDVFDEFVRRWGTPTDGLGFVSGHSAVAFSLAGVVSPYLGRWRWLGYGLAAAVSLARIHVGAHLPLDTVGGAALGLMLAFGYNAAVGVPRDPRQLADRHIAG